MKHFKRGCRSTYFWRSSLTPWSWSHAVIPQKTRNGFRFCCFSGQIEEFQGFGETMRCFYAFKNPSFSIESLQNYTQLTEKSYFGNACISSCEITWELLRAVILGGCNSFIYWKCFNNDGVTRLNVLIKTGRCIKTRWPKHSPPAWFQFSWYLYLYFNFFEACGGKIRAEIRQRLLHSRILLGRTRSPELQTWRSRQWRGKHQGEPSLRCWCASNCQIPKKQLSIKSATKVVLNNMEKKLQTTSSQLSEGQFCVLDLFQHKLIWRLL